MANWHPAVAAAQGRQEERKLRPDQVARILGVKPHQVRKLWRQGKLRGEKSSARNLRFTLAAVQEYQESLND